MTAQTPPRSRADRYGQLAFVLIVCGLFGDALLWAAGGARHHWWFWPLVIVTCTAWVALIGTGIAASLDKRPRGGR